MTSNASRVDQYLHAVAAMGVPEAVSDFSAPDVIFHEFPNRIVPRGRVSRFADLGAAYEQGRKILKSQEYEVQRVVEAGDEVAVELEWRGILAVSGDEFARRQRNERFLTFRDGKIVSQRSYACYPPFGEQPGAGPSAGLFAYE